MELLVGIVLGLALGTMVALEVADGEILDRLAHHWPVLATLLAIMAFLAFDLAMVALITA